MLIKFIYLKTSHVCYKSYNYFDNSWLISLQSKRARIAINNSYSTLDSQLVAYIKCVYLFQMEDHKMRQEQKQTVKPNE